jgi:hypothetical protein
LTVVGLERKCARKGSTLPIVEDQERWESHRLHSQCRCKMSLRKAWLVHLRLHQLARPRIVARLSQRPLSHSLRRLLKYRDHNLLRQQRNLPQPQLLPLLQHHLLPPLHLLTRPNP